ncbi:hypothetical protein NM688_g911 [Phlebia brevispora]|uniref:Uncharacterized protein n=1 Tax=Phlebia brevispora TaxID=194682 RepID=A0ACC1TDA9_9APHY|nr:hypothetical protein NM688_g911 [Phlebia brevispora]
MSSPPHDHGSTSPDQLTATPETPEVFARASGAPAPPSLTPSRTRHQNVLKTPEASPRGPQQQRAADEEVEDNDWLPPTLYNGRDEQEALCCIAVEVVKKEETREAPWYAPWALYLQHAMRQLQVPARGIVSLTMPQYPARAEFDTYEADLEKGFSDAVRSDRGASHDSDQQSRTGSSPPTPDALYRATRIPDFVQLIYWSYRGPNDLPKRSEGRFALVIEVKALRGSRRLRLPVALADMKSQTDEQIKFVFTGPEDRIPAVIGVISTVGPYWWYREFDRRSVSPLPSYGEYMDPSYKPSRSRELSDGSTVPSTPSASPAVDTHGPHARPLPQYLEYYFFGDRVLKLGTDRSTRALRDIAKRIRDLNSDVYEYVSISYS